MAKVTAYQVLVNFRTPPYVYVNLYSEGAQIARIQVDDPVFVPQIAFAVEMLRTGSNIDWDENIQGLSFNVEATGQP